MLEFVDSLPSYSRGRRTGPRSQASIDLVEFAESGKGVAHMVVDSDRRRAGMCARSYAKRHYPDIDVVTRGGEIYLIRNGA